MLTKFDTTVFVRIFMIFVVSRDVFNQFQLLYSSPQFAFCRMLNIWHWQPTYKARENLVIVGTPDLQSGDSGFAITGGVLHDRSSQSLQSLRSGKLVPATCPLVIHLKWMNRVADMKYRKLSCRLPTINEYFFCVVKIFQTSE